MSAPDAFVSLVLDGQRTLVGRLWITATPRHQRATFTYDDAWLHHPNRFALEPALSLGPDPYYTADRQVLFGALGDSAPDRWGRTLLARAERQRAAAAGQAPRALRELDYLLGVADATRMGALRFHRTEEGPFAAYAGAAIPPLVALPQLLAASDRLDATTATDDDVRLLLAPGSSLGGARPKASVLDADGTLAIAKFPAPSDARPVVAWEAVCLTLARDAGVPVPPHRLVTVAGRDVLLLQRFDRVGGAPDGIRLPYLSTVSLLGARDGERRSYVEIAEALRQWSAAAAADLADLWRRVVFTVLVSNTDDHLRNHGVLCHGTDGWRLAPAFDLNPVSPSVAPRLLATPILTDGDPTAALPLAFEFAQDCGLKAADARAIAREVGIAVAAWRRVAQRVGLGPAEQAAMADAFEHADLAAAI